MVDASRLPTVAGWCLAASGIAMILICTVAGRAMVAPLEITGCVMFVFGAVVFGLGQFEP
jgi:ABC-type enterochelin transport system permease subunit